MKVANSTLIAKLVSLTKDHLNQGIHFLQLENRILSWKASPTEWSILECIEHLNRYGEFYLPEISQCLKNTPQASTETPLVFNSGWLGNYFAKSMLPKEKLNKMKTFKSMNPLGSHLDKSTLETFTDQQKQMLQLLNLAQNVDLTRTKTAISISKWIKLRLGDTLRVVIYHNQRHIVQAKNIQSKQ